MERSHHELPLSEEQKMFDIKQPHHNDVLCGRGVTTNRHPGNESFRALVGVNKEVYVSSTKKQKMAISRSIVEAVRSLVPPGRFLEKNPRTGLWSDIGHKKAVEKTSQALRDGAASLRKQLSADLGDPDFLNAVFDIDVVERDKKINQAGSNEEIKEKAGDKIITRGKENNKLKSIEKTRAFKSRTTVVKKGHRRVHSNPSIRNNWRGKPLRGEYEMEAPVAHFSPSRSFAPPMSPCSTPVHQQISYPTTPKTWNGRPTLPESSDLEVLYHPHSHQDTYCYQDLHPREPQEPLYRYPDTPKRWSEQWGTSDHRPSRHAPLVKHPLSAPPVCHSWSPSETYHHPPTLLPRHQFSPTGYHSQSHPADWTPRMMPRRADYLYSPHRHSYNHTYRPMAQNEWRTSAAVCSHTSNYPSQEYDRHTAKEVFSSGLSVPALGGEANDPMPTRVLLAPRSRRQIGNHPTRPPKYQASDFIPPPSSPRLSREAMRVEKETVQYMRTGRESKRGDLSQPLRETEASPIGEEKKSDERSIPNQDDIFLPLAFSLKPRRCSPYSQENDDELRNMDSPKIEALETTSNSAAGRFVKEEPEVEDIVMSPVPEDPKTLMEVPENILTLPISPFGPNDDPS